MLHNAKQCIRIVSGKYKLPNYYVRTVLTQIIPFSPQFEPQTLVSEVCRAIRGLPGAAQGQCKLEVWVGDLSRHDHARLCPTHNIVA